MTESFTPRAAEPRSFGVQKDASDARTPLADAWDSAIAAHAAAKAEDARLLALSDAADAAVEVEVPTPDILRRSEDGRWTESAILADHGSTLAEKAARMEALASWQPAVPEAQARLGSEAATQAWEDHDGVSDTFEALVDLPAPTLEALVFKVRLVLEQIACGFARHDVDTADTISELLGGGYDEHWATARIYQDLLRHTGQRPDLSSAEPFDVEAWARAFEAHPGHTLTG